MFIWFTCYQVDYIMYVVISTLYIHITIQLNGNLMPVLGENTQVNLQSGTGKGSGARNGHFTNPTPYGVHFDARFLNVLVLILYCLFTVVYNEPLRLVIDYKTARS